MNNMLDLLLAFAAGAVVGLYYFFNLWWTVRRLPEARRPGRMLLASLVLRALPALAIFFLFSSGGWQGLTACLLGFMLMRTVLVRQYRPDRITTRKVS